MEQLSFTPANPFDYFDHRHQEEGISFVVSPPNHKRDKENTSGNRSGR
jgi:hypothetical protein